VKSLQLICIKNEKCFPWLIKHHDIKTYRGGGIAPCILNSGTRYEVSGQLHALVAFFPPGKKFLDGGGWAEQRGSPNAVEKRNISNVAGNRSPISRSSNSFPSHYTGWGMWVPIEPEVAILNSDRKWTEFHYRDYTSVNSQNNPQEYTCTPFKELENMLPYSQNPIIECCSPPILVYFPYYEKIKVGLWDHHAVYVFMYPYYRLLNDWTSLYETWYVCHDSWHVSPSECRTS
jgi:hypothetical protein